MGGNKHLAANRVPVTKPTSVEMFGYHMNKSPFQTYSYNISDVDRGKNDTVLIFWTGGWDSTFRILQLAKEDIVVQPIYLDDARKSTERELRAIDTIAVELQEQATTIFKLEDLLTISTKAIKNNAAITAAYKRLRQEQFMGSQYDWLARFADGLEGVELCIHQDDKALKVIEKCGSIKLVEGNQPRPFYVIDTIDSRSDLVKVFGSFRFPLLNMTKIEMKEEAERLGQMSFMHQTWFCFEPINDKPCGVCNPCIYAIEEGMSWRFNAAALRRYRLRYARKILGKMRRAISLVLSRSGLYRVQK